MNQSEKQPRPATPVWVRPAIEWEENYEPVVLAVSCASQPGVCNAGPRL
jgi:hypothetical protein